MSETANPAPKALTPEEAKARAAISMRIAANFGGIVGMLVRNPHYKHYSIADLEWLVMPAMVNGQYSVVEAQVPQNGASTPVAYLLWAQVSEEVDRRLGEDLSRPIKLRPDEWRSGSIVWIVDAMGDQRVVGDLMNRLRSTIWACRPVKIRAAGPEGRLVLHTLPPMAAAKADGQGTKQDPGKAVAEPKQ